MKKVSIVLPVYNGKRYIKEAVDSILDQDYFNFELIIVNDCSTDETGIILEEYINKDKRIKVINNKKNMKLPKSLNIGFSYAQGEYYTWTSDDNMLIKNMLSTLVNFLEENEDVGMVYSNYVHINQDGYEIEKVKMKEPRYLIYGNYVGACFLYRKQVAEKVGEYDSSLYLAEDYDYWMRISRETVMRNVPDYLYMYRLHDNSLTSTKIDDIKVQTYRAMAKNFITLYFMTKSKKERILFYENIIRYAPQETKEKLYTFFSKFDFTFKMKYKRKRIVLYINKFYNKWKYVVNKTEK